MQRALQPERQKIKLVKAAPVTPAMNSAELNNLICESIDMVSG
jgi:hypothetical protein